MSSRAKDEFAMDHRHLFGIDLSRSKHSTVVLVVDRDGVVKPSAEERLGVIYNEETGAYWLAPGKGTTFSPFEAYVYSQREAYRMMLATGNEWTFRPFPSMSTAAPAAEAPKEQPVPSPQSESAKRKATPVWSGVLRYFPDAICAVARLSKAGNDKHNPGQPLHWARGKSNDHADAEARHLLTPELMDEEVGELHATAKAWRALADLQLLEEKRLGEKSLAYQLEAARKKEAA